MKLTPKMHLYLDNSMGLSDTSLVKHASQMAMKLILGNATYEDGRIVISDAQADKIAWWIRSGMPISLDFVSSDQNTYLMNEFAQSHFISASVKDIVKVGNSISHCPSIVSSGIFDNMEAEGTVMNWFDELSIYIKFGMAEHIDHERKDTSQMIVFSSSLRGHTLDLCHKAACLTSSMILRLFRERDGSLLIDLKEGHSLLEWLIYHQPKEVLVTNDITNSVAKMSNDRVDFILDATSNVAITTHPYWKPLLSYYRSTLEKL